MPRKWLGPLGARLALAFITVALIAVAILSGLTLVASRNEVADLVRGQQDQDAAEIAAVLSRAYTEERGWRGADLSGAFALAASARADLVVLDEEGRLVTSTSSEMDDLMASMHGDEMMATLELDAPRRVDVDADGVRVGTAEIRFPAAGSPAPEREVQEALARTVVAGSGLATLVALTASVFVSRRVIRPLVALTGAARRLEAGDRDARANLPDAPGELGELAAGVRPDGGRHPARGRAEANAGR